MLLNQSGTALPRKLTNRTSKHQSWNSHSFMKEHTRSHHRVQNSTQTVRLLKGHTPDSEAASPGLAVMSDYLSERQHEQPDSGTLSGIPKKYAVPKL